MDNVTASGGQRDIKAAKDLKPGDRIPAGFLPNRQAAEVLYVTTFPLPSTGDLWVMVAYRLTDWAADAEHFSADAPIPVEPADTGLGFSREADDPAPVSPARVPLHVIEPLSQIAEDGHKLDETTRPRCTRKCRNQLLLGGIDHLTSCPVAHAEAQR